MTNEEQAALVERIICPKCGLEPKRTDTRYGLRLDCCGLWAWGENPLVDAATHEARKVAHAAFDPIWKSGLLKRGDAYGMLANAMGISRKECHMKLMTAAQAAKVPAIAAQIREKQMTNEERAALVKWFRTGAEVAREERGQRLSVELDTAANQIEADGKRIAELEKALKGVTESYNHWTAVTRARAALGETK